MSPLTEYLVLAFTFIVVTFYIYHKIFNKIENFFNQIPAPPGSWFFGNARDYITETAILKNLHKYTKIYGSMLHIKFGPFTHLLLTSDYDFVEFLLKSNKLVRKTVRVRYFKPWLGEGLVSTDGLRWKKHRKMLTPAFHFKILEQFVDTFESGGNILVNELSKISGSDSVDIFPYMNRCTFDIICETAMGTKVDAQDKEKYSYLKSVREMSGIFMLRNLAIFLRYDLIFRFSKYYEIQTKAIKILHDYSNKVISARRKQLKEKLNNGDNMEKKKKRVFIDLLLESSVDGQTLSQEKIREEVDTFMFGGHDTTATALSFILFCIANDKSVQQKIIKEQKYLFGTNKNPTVTYANLQEMRYLENVTKEGLRLYAPIPFFGREIDQDVEYNGMLIPKGVDVMVFTHGLHMNPEYYPEPEKFDPSRFEDLENKHPFAFIPFSAGPRNCIGQKYAMLEIKSIVSKVVRNFELLPAYPKHEMDIAPELVLKSLNGVKIGLKLR